MWCIQYRWLFETCCFSSSTLIAINECTHFIHDIYVRHHFVIFVVVNYIFHLVAPGKKSFRISDRWVGEIEGELCTVTNFNVTTTRHFWWQHWQKKTIQTELNNWEHLCRQRDWIVCLILFYFGCDVNRLQKCHGKYQPKSKFKTLQCWFTRILMSMHVTKNEVRYLANGMSKLAKRTDKCAHTHLFSPHRHIPIEMPNFESHRFIQPHTSEFKSVCCWPDPLLFSPYLPISHFVSFTPSLGHSFMAILNKHRMCTFVLFRLNSINIF